MDIDAQQVTEEVEGHVDCYNCEYSGKMQGYIPFDDTKFILFVCPECEAIERVVNIYG